MKDKKLGQDPMYPTKGLINWKTSEVVDESKPGISKRLYIKTALMQGILANNVVVDKDTFHNILMKDSSTCQYLIKNVQILADEMLKQELEEIDD